jgi:hypothetical protein
MEEEERTYKTTVEIKVLGYLIGSGVNEDKPIIVHREGSVEVATPRERVMLTDTHPGTSVAGGPKSPDSRRVQRGFFRGGNTVPDHDGDGIPDPEYADLRVSFDTVPNAKARRQVIESNTRFGLDQTAEPEIDPFKC